MNAALEADLLGHLDAQLASARALLALVLAQGAAIRRRDVESVLGCLAEIQAEMGRRGVLEQERTALLQRAGASLGSSPSQVTLERLCRLVSPGGAAAARERSAELRGVLAEIAREHGINRALMRQELAFLAHLTRLVGHADDAGYARTGPTRPGTGAPPMHRILDMQA